MGSQEFELPRDSVAYIQQFVQRVCYGRIVTSEVAVNPNRHVQVRMPYLSLHVVGVTQGFQGQHRRTMSESLHGYERILDLFGKA